MLPLFSAARFFRYSEVTDIRKSFDGLSGIVSSSLKEYLLSGDVFILINRCRNRMKLLVWDRTGFWLFPKDWKRELFNFHPTQS
jgi:transposase